MSYNQMMKHSDMPISDFKDPVYQDYIAHHGILGMKWGVRNYQNSDGSLKPEGEKRYSIGDRIHSYNVAKKRKQALEKARQTRVQREKEAKIREQKLKNHKLPLKDMTNEELQSYQTRLGLIKDVEEKRRATDLGYQFTSKMKENVISGIASGTQKAVTDIVQQAIGYTVNSMVSDSTPLAKTYGMDKNGSSNNSGNNSGNNSNNDNTKKKESPRQVTTTEFPKLKYSDAKSFTKFMTSDDPLKLG